MIKNFFNVAGADAVKRIAEWIRHKFYTKTEIDDMLSAGMRYEVVEELPATGEAGKVYLVPKQSAGTGDVYDEYIYVDGSYEHIGSTEIDLSNYYTKTQADDLLDDKVDKVNGKGLSTEDYTTAEKTKLGGIEAGAEVNVQSDWNQSDSTKDDFIKNKPTLRQPATDGTSGQYLKSNGSGNAPSWETMDSAPTENSTKAVTSGGVKTALDGKQASISITTNANTPTDNDTVIMQDSGNTGTTSFLRRKLSTLWTYIKGKADGVYVPFGYLFNKVNVNGLPVANRLYDVLYDDALYGADERFSVSRTIYSNTTDEVIGTLPSANIFRAAGSGYANHPAEGEREVILIQPKSLSASDYIFTYGYGYWVLDFDYNQQPDNVKIRFRKRNEEWTQYYDMPRYAGTMYRYGNTSSASTSTYLNAIEVVIYGKNTFNNTTSLVNFFFVSYRPSNGRSGITKHSSEKDIYGNIIAPKFIMRGGTSSQYLRADGSTATISTTPTSGSSSPITSGAVYTALNNKQNKFLTFDIPDNSGYATLTLISDITESFSTPNYVGHGIVGFMYGWRAGNLSGSTAQRITCWGNHDTSYVKLQTDNNNNNALKPLLVYYNSRYYLALKKGKRSGMTHYFVGYSANLLSTRINLYANSNETKWYSDSGRTTEVTFTITKDYSRYEGAYLDFGGTASQVVLGTGELKTIDSSVASGSSNLVTSGAVATAIAGVDLSGKVNLQPDFTASQIDYSAGNVGKWQKVLRFPEGADLVINMKKTAMGSDSTSTLWFSSSSVGDSYTSLFGNHSVRFVHDGGYVFLVLACRKSTNEPIESYTFQIAHSSVPMSDIVAVTEASPITATPKEPSIIYRAPITTGAVSFNVTNGAGSVSMSGHNDFLGNMTSEATNGVVVTMSGATEGQIYRFVFTRNITGGVTFKQSNVAYCTISGDVNAGDTITLTAVSNTADGWLYEQESAGIKSTDGSVNVEYDGGVADLSLNLPPDIVKNNVYYARNSHLAMAIGLRATCDTLAKAVAVGCDSESGNASVAVGGDAVASNTFCVAVGNSAVATSSDSTAVGKESTASGSRSCAYGSGSVASGTRSMAFGYGATAKNNSMTFGYNAKAQVNATAYGYEANGENYSTAMGYQANAKANSTAVGYLAKAGIPSSDTDRPSLKVSDFEAIQFSEGGSSKFARFCETTDDVTITVSGSDYTLTPPAANKLLFVINDFNAQYMTSSVTHYAKVNGEDVYLNTNYYLTLSKVHLASNKYAVWMDTNANYLPAVITSLSILAYYTTTETIAYTTAIGQGCRSAHTMSSAIGVNLFAVRGNQTVIGCGNIPDYDAWFIVGAGSDSDNGKKNILKIDTNERMIINAGYVGGTQEINMNNQTGSLSNITKAVYRIKWDGTGEVTLTLNTSGCVEGQRVTIFAETNDVKLFAQPYIIRQGRFCDFMFLGGAWRPSMGIEELVS